MQNADPDKPVAALGQTYFAVQTRRAELADELDELAGLTEAQKRLALRQQMASRNVELAAQLHGAVLALRGQVAAPSQAQQQAPTPAPIPDVYVKAKAALDALVAAIGADQQAA